MNENVNENKNGLIRMRGSLGRNMSMKVAIPVMIGILVLVIVLKCFGLLTFRSGTRLGFVGNDTLHKYNGTYAKITGTMIHTLSPSKDSDTIHCVFTTKSGTLHVEVVQKSDNKVLLDKDIDGDETLDLPAEGKVKIKLTTSGHSGSYKFEY